MLSLAPIASGPREHIPPKNPTLLPWSGDKRIFGLYLNGNRGRKHAQDLPNFRSFPCGSFIQRERCGSQPASSAPSSSSSSPKAASCRRALRQPAWVRYLVGRVPESLTEARVVGGMSVPPTMKSIPRLLSDKGTVTQLRASKPSELQGSEGFPFSG